MRSSFPLGRAAAVVICQMRRSRLRSVAERIGPGTSRLAEFHSTAVLGSVRAPGDMAVRALPTLRRGRAIEFSRRCWTNRLVVGSDINEKIGFTGMARLSWRFGQASRGEA